MARPEQVIRELEELKSGKSRVEGSASGQAVSFTGEGAVGLFRLKTLRQGLKLEALGMRLTAKAPKATTILRREYGMKGDRDKLAAQLDKLIAEYEEAAGLR